jgi:hypothetical protein
MLRKDKASSGDGDSSEHLSDPSESELNAGGERG